jgi:hypothetical protein
VQQALDYTNSILASEGGPDCWDVIREPKLVLVDRTYGHADCVLLHKTKLIAHGIDAKFTRIEGQHSFQVRAYGAALYEMLLGDSDVLVPIGDETYNCRNLDWITTHVVAPRLKGTAHEPETYNARDLYLAVCKEIDDLYERINNPFLPPTAGDHCGNCGRAAICPALSTTAVAVSRGVGLPVPEAFAPDALVSLKDRAIAQVLAIALENWAKQIKENNNEFADQGGTIPGFKRVKRSTGARIPKESTPRAVELLKEAGMADEGMVLAASTISINDLAALKAELTPGANEKQIKEDLRETLAEVIREGSASYLQKERNKVPDAKLLEEIAAG